MKTALLALLVFCFCPHLARGEPFGGELRVELLVESVRADTDMLAVSPSISSGHSQVEPFPVNCSVQAPDISRWEVVSKSRTEFRMSDTAVAYLGLYIEYTEYRNPINTREFARVISRHIPLVPEQKKLNERIIFDAATALYARKEEQDRLDELDEKIDPILYIQWRTKKNPHTGKNVQDGDVDLWFLKPSGECFIAKNEKVGIQFLTENVGNGKPRNVFVGVKYQIGDVYHILKVNRSDVLLLMNGGK